MDVLSRRDPINQELHCRSSTELSPNELSGFLFTIFPSLPLYLLAPHLSSYTSTQPTSSPSLPTNLISNSFLYTLSLGTRPLTFLSTLFPFSPYLNYNCNINIDLSIPLNPPPPFLLLSLYLYVSLQVIQQPNNLYQDFP